MASLQTQDQKQDPETIYLIHEDVNLLINGYIKCTYSEDIASDVIDLFIKFYWIGLYDRWDELQANKDFPDAFTFDKDQSQVTYNNLAGLVYRSIFGMIRISKLTKMKIWKIQCINNDAGRFGFILGLALSRDKYDGDTNPGYYNGYNWDSYYGRSARGHDLVTEKPEKNAIITVKYETIDCKSKDGCYGRLSIAINDWELVSSSKKIPIDGNEVYKLAVSFCSDDTIKLLQ